MPSSSKKLKTNSGSSKSAKEGISNQDIANYYFEKKNDDPNDSIFVCKFCSCERTQNRSGYTNLVEHVFREHLNYEEVMNIKSEKPGLKLITNQTGSNVFHWMELLVHRNYPFTEVEDSIVRKNSRNDPISINTLKKYMSLIVKDVEAKIAADLPNKFGIMLDGWSHNTTHYVALYACTFNGLILLSMGVVLDDWHEKMDTDSYIDYINFIIREVYGKSLDSLLFLVADNANINPKIAKKLGIPMVGCYSHRLNLWVKSFLEPYEDLITAVNDLMIKFTNLKWANALQKESHLKAKIRNVTRWSSTFQTLTRYLELKDAIARVQIPEKIEFEDKIRSVESSLKITVEQLHQRLIDVDRVTVMLQERKLTIVEAQTLVDTLMDEFKDDKYIDANNLYLKKDARINKSKDFLNGILKVMTHQEDKLTPLEKCYLLKFEKPIPDAQVVKQKNNAPDKFEMAILRLKNPSVNAEATVYYDLSFIPATSCEVERLFSLSGHILTYDRSRMTPAEFEELVFLKSNPKYWDISSVSRIAAKRNEARQVVEEEINENDRNGVFERLLGSCLFL